MNDEIMKVNMNMNEWWNHESKYEYEVTDGFPAKQLVTTYMCYFILSWLDCINKMQPSTHLPRRKH